MCIIFTSSFFSNFIINKHKTTVIFIKRRLSVVVLVLIIIIIVYMGLVRRVIYQTFFTRNLLSLFHDDQPNTHREILTKVLEYLPIYVGSLVPGYNTLECSNIRKHQWYGHNEAENFKLLSGISWRVRFFFIVGSFCSSFTSVCYTFLPECIINWAERIHNEWFVIDNGPSLCLYLPPPRSLLRYIITKKIKEV